uniref:Uncharacterized protein n=1 Tax=Aegilops tauschii subsp. strangulata TaxID=200361 RepID=A0A453LVH2_AEGTS
MMIYLLKELVLRILLSRLNYRRLTRLLSFSYFLPDEFRNKQVRCIFYAIMEYSIYLKVGPLVLFTLLLSRFV